jgi:hypothetical protein
MARQVGQGLVSETLKSLLVGKSLGLRTLFGRRHRRIRNDSGAAAASSLSMITIPLLGGTARGTGLGCDDRVGSSY